MRLHLCVCAAVCDHGLLAIAGMWCAYVSISELFVTTDRSPFQASGVLTFVSVCVCACVCAVCKGCCSPCMKLPFDGSSGHQMTGSALHVRVLASLRVLDTGSKEDCEMKRFLRQVSLESD